MAPRYRLPALYPVVASHADKLAIQSHRTNRVRELPRLAGLVGDLQALLHHRGHHVLAVWALASAGDFLARGLQSGGRRCGQTAPIYPPVPAVSDLAV